MKIAVIREKFSRGKWEYEVLDITEGTWQDVDCYNDPDDDDSMRYFLPFEQVGEEPLTGYVWNKFEYTAARIENGKIVGWYSGYQAEDIFESLWGNIF